MRYHSVSKRNEERLAAGETRHSVYTCMHGHAHSGQPQILVMWYSSHLYMYIYPAQSQDRNGVLFTP